ncbi:MAG: M48 family metalloprotease, partial [Comamonadaceae bacterium]|nr:M48 family metalloprotease [Comamonadaceae bacterium]
MTPLQERKLGDRIARELFRDPAYFDDPVIAEWVDSLWRPLRAAARQRGELPAELDERYAWRVLLGRGGDINAFALPGGYFGLYLGLVGVVDTRDELASVLAHEMAHVTQRHISRMIGQQSRQTPLLLASMVLGALAASRNPQAAAALAVGGQAAALQQQLGYSRDMEREADRIGYGIFTQAGFAPRGAAGMFEKLQHASRLSDRGDWPYLRSHPLTTERLAEARRRAPQAAQPTAPDLAQAQVSARARVLARPGVDVLRAWAAAPQDASLASQPPARRVAALYAAALARAELRDLPGAQALAEPLAALTAASLAAARQTRLLQADLALRAGQHARVQTLLKNTQPPGPEGRPERLL